MKLFVGNVPDNSNPVELRQLFEEYGRVSECEIIRDYAFIHMPSEADATKARLSLHYYNFNGSRLNVRKATSPVPRKSCSYASYSILKPSPKHKKKWPQPQKKAWKVIAKPKPVEADHETAMDGPSSFPALDENVSTSQEVTDGSEHHCKGNAASDIKIASASNIGTDESLARKLESSLSLTPRLHLDHNASASSDNLLDYGARVQYSPFITEEDILPSYNEFAKQVEAFYTRPLEAWSLENAH